MTNDTNSAQSASTETLVLPGSSATQTWPLESSGDFTEPEAQPETSHRKKLVCEVCGNEYDKAFTVTCGSESHVFDSFECAIHALAPTCKHCKCKVVGHGVEDGGDIFCCASCARHSGVIGLHDRV